MGNRTVPLLFFFLAGPLFSGTVETCAQYQTVKAGAYSVLTGYWNKDKCPGTQCLSVNDKTGAFTVTKATYSCGYNVSAYPCVLYGKAFGVASDQNDLPIQIGALKSLTSDWSFTPTYTGAWDAAYDIWICPDDNCGPGGFNGGAEVMVWLDYFNTGGWKQDEGPVHVAGSPWEVWTMKGGSGGDQWNYVAYLAKNKMTAVRGLDLKAILDDCGKRGYIKPSWYLYAVEAGNEIHSDGIPFTSNSFSVSVNKGPAVKPAFKPAVTPTATIDPAAAGMPLPP